MVIKNVTAVGMRPPGTLAGGGRCALCAVVQAVHGAEHLDPVTGLGTPNAAVLLPDLVNAVHGH
jgi:hypothetical protein